MNLIMFIWGRERTIYHTLAVTLLDAYKGVEFDTHLSLVYFKKENLKKILGVRNFFGFVAIQIAINLHRTYERIHCKEEPYRF